VRQSSGALERGNWTALKSGKAGFETGLQDGQDEFLPELNPVNPVHPV
jgi:hypothetical protein